MHAHKLTFKCQYLTPQAANASVNALPFLVRMIQQRAHALRKKQNCLLGDHVDP